MGWGLPLEWLVGLVGTGVPLAIVLAHLTGGSQRRELDEAELERLVNRELDGGVIDEALVSDDGHSAMVRLTDGTLAIAWVMESHTGIRVLGTHQVSERGDALLIQQPDPGFPRLVVPLAAAEHREHWLQRLGGAHGAA